MKAFEPYSEGASSEVAGLTFESDPSKVSMYGSVDFPRDAGGLATAKAIMERLQAVVAVLEAGPLPGKQADEAPVEVANPFG